MNMLKIYLSLATMLCFIAATGQTKRAFEFSFITRYDQHVKNHVTVKPGRDFNPATTLSGMSYGINIGYRHRLQKNYSLFLGLGYYELGIDKIRETTPSGSNPNVVYSREIQNVDHTKIVHYTDKYQYNNLALTIGLNKIIPVKSKLALDFGAEAVAYYSISQRYHVGEFHEPPSFLAHDAKPLMFGFNGTAGILKEYKKFYVRPALIIPIYQQMGGDERFQEARSENISKWFSGLGATIRIGRYF